MKEYLLTTNKFDVPEILQDNNAIYTLLIRLLLLTPGTIQSRPTMGVGIVTKWRYMDIDKIPDLQSDITNQVSIYLPFLQGVDVQLSADEYNKELIIKISVDSVLYVMETDLANNTIKLINI